MTRKSYRIILGFTILLIIMIITSGCIETSVDFAVNSNGDGTANIKIAASEPMFNEFIDEAIAELRRINPRVKIKERYQNKCKIVEAEVAFKDVSELSQYGFSVAHFRAEKKHRVEIAITEDMFMKSLTLKMPGKITASNGTFSGSKASFENYYMGGLYWAESEEALGGGPIFAVIVMVVLLTVVGLTIRHFVTINTAADINVRDNESPNRFCANCGALFQEAERFCSQCGAKRV